jgi:diguanylate cyclase (GGDEF)-like protein
MVPLTPQQRIESECLNMLGPELRRMLMVSFPLTLIVVAGLWKHAGQAHLLLWLGISIAASAVLAFVAGFETPLDVPGAITARRREIVIGCGGLALSWTLGVFIVYPSINDHAFRPLLALGICGAVGAMGLGTLLCRPAMFVLILPSTASIVVRFSFGSGLERAVAAIAGVIALGFALHGSAANHSSVTLVRNRIENDLLSRKLQRSQELRSLMETELQRVATNDREDELDPVTGVRNRKAFIEIVADHWQQAEAGFDPFTMVMVDIDQYDEIRDRHGADISNELLKQVAGLVDTGLRTDDILARVNNSQFAVLLNNALSDGAVICLERIRRKVAATPFDVGEPMVVSISAGMVTWDKGMGIRQLMSRADMSLQRAKDTGGNQLSVWGDALRASKD